MLSDFRSAVRGLRREPGATFLIVLTLALGVGANTAIFSIVNGVLLTPLAFRTPDRIVVVQEVNGRGEVAGNAPANFLDLERRSRTFEALAAIREDTFELTGAREPAHLDGAHVTRQFFDVFGVAPFLGRTFRQGEDARGAEGKVVLSYDTWQERFASDSRAVGRVIHLNGQAHAIAGVMPPDFRFREGLGVWVLATDGVPPSPIEIDGPLSEERQVRYFDVVGRIRASSTLEEARADAISVAKAIEREHPETSEGTYRVRTLHDFTVGDVRFALLVLLASVGLVLLIACANVASLLLARATARQREVAVRAALGASRGQIARLFLAESLVIALLGGTLAIVVSAWSLDGLRALAATAVPRAESITLDYRVGLFAAALTLGSAIIFGLAPVGLLGQLGLHESLKASTARSGGSRTMSRLRKGLVVGEIAFAVVLLVGAGLMVRSLWQLLAVEPGLQTVDVTAAMLPLPVNRYPTLGQQADAYHRVLEEVRRQPGVSGAAVAFPLPFQGKGSSASFTIEGVSSPSSRANRPVALFNAASTGYFRTLGIPLLRGRDFQETDRENSIPVVIVSRAFVERYLAKQDPIGRRLFFGDEEPVTIVGMVGDFRRESLDQPPAPMLFVPYRQFSLPFMTVLVRSTAPHALVTTRLRQAMGEIDRDLALAEVTTLEDVRSRSTAQPRFRALALGLFGGLALLLASIGVYGLLSQSVAQRTRELGVRIAVGAKPADVYRLVIGEGLRLASLGLGAGVVLALAASKAVSALLFGITPTDVPTFAAVVSGLVVVAIAASFLPARRAMRVNPIEALRSE